MGGKFIVITGPMFSGKTTELIREARRQAVAQKKVQIFNPKMDERYSKENLLSHDKMLIETQRAATSDELLSLVSEDTDVVGIDELHFFDAKVIDACEKLADSGKIIIVTALNQNFLGVPFPFAFNSSRNMGEVLALADEVRHLNAVCTFIKENGKQCSQQATKTQRFVDGKPAPRDAENILVGGAESYAPRCRTHYSRSG